MISTRADSAGCGIASPGGEVQASEPQVARERLFLAIIGRLSVASTHLNTLRLYFAGKQTIMNIAKIALSVCLSVFVLACGDSTSDSSGTPADSAGGKADGVGGCGDIEADFLQCSDNSLAETCNTYVRDTYPDAGSCCVSDVQPYAMCPAYAGAESCEAVNDEYLGCSAATDTATCNRILRDGYPDAGSCCGRDFEDYELCAAYVTEQTCDEVSDDYAACNTNGGEADCDEYLREYHPSGVGCCDLQGYQDICAAYVEVNDSTCEAIEADYDECLEGDGPSECNYVLQVTYPWGVNCCLLDGFTEVCNAYGGGGPLTCDDINNEYLNCTAVEEEAMCDIIFADSYPDAGSCCGRDFEDYEVCSAYD